MRRHQREFLEKVDKKIKKWKNKSKIAPPRFLEAELRRRINRELIVDDWRRSHGRVFTRKNAKLYCEDGLFGYHVPILEQEYQCYFGNKRFNPKKLLEGLNDKGQIMPGNKIKGIFAGYNGQIEWFLEKENLIIMN